MRSPEIRERFLHFFERRGHHRLPSASLVAHDDPTVLFTVAGMVPLQPFFRGARTPPAGRVTSCQKCLRTDDIEAVGDASHNTFFEMLGNFSFGDYFKEEAIGLAWELLTTEFGLDPARLWPSVHPGDRDAAAIWTGMIGVPAERLSLLSDNFWGPVGPTGPCGYDSEVYWDWGGPCSCGRFDCRPDSECGGDRWSEIWNLVFPEFDQDASGGRTPLPRPGIDTGMGFERICAVLQGVRSSYESDLFAGIVEGFRVRAAAIAADADLPEAGRSLNVLADHLRASTFLIADGVLPANESRGYVLRRLIRRARVHGRRLGLEGGLAAGVGDLVAVMGPAYPEIVEHRGLVERTLSSEEEAFERTLAGGTERLESLLVEAGTRGGRPTVAGEDAFRLHDTFGFPIELTVELAAERGAAVDLPGFATAMAEQRGRSRRAHQGSFASGPRRPPTTFVGYDTLECEAVVIEVDAGAGRVIIEPTPFYAESGGQVGDRGRLDWPGGGLGVVDSRFVPGTETRYLSVEGPVETLAAGSRVSARVDAARRAQTARHHSATHLLHRALRDVLGEGAVQRGSLVDAVHATFDFSFGRGLSPAELRDVQHRVNDAIRRDLARAIAVMPVSEARAAGAVALFGEKYGEEVRVVDFGGWARELCGGTHVERSGEIGAAIIVSEVSIGQGIRRIEMLAGEAAERRWTDDLAALRELSQQLRARVDELPARLAALQRQVRQAQREAAEARRQAAAGAAGGGPGEVEEHGGLRLAHRQLEGGADSVKAAVDSLFADRLGGRGVALAVGTDKLAVKVGEDARAAGIDAARLVRAAAEATGGRGGGRPDFGTGGIGDPALRPAVLGAVRDGLDARTTAPA